MKALHSVFPQILSLFNLQLLLFITIFILTRITKRPGQKNFLTLEQTWFIATRIQKIFILFVASVDILF